MGVKTMNWKTWLTVLAAAASVAACGGGGGAGTPLYGTTTTTTTTPTATASTVDVSSSSLQLGSAASESVTITVVVKGTGSVVMPDTAVSLTASSGSLVVNSSKTDSTGVVTATLTAGSAAADKANRTITVTATSGSASGSVQVQVVGTTAAFSGATSLSAGSTPASFSILVKDSKGAVIPGAVVTSSASQIGNALASNTATTDGNGAATFSYTPTNAGSDSLIFSVLGTTVTASLAVSGQDFTFVSPAASTSVTVGSSQTVRVRYRVSGVAQAGQTVNFASTAGSFSGSTTVLTDVNGEATASLSSTFAGTATVSATISGVGTTTLPLSFVAVTPANLVLQISPSAIGPNSGASTTQQATVLARVTDSNGNPVKSQTVNFTRTADASGGNLSAASAITDANGEASVKYISGPNSTSNNGVTIAGTVQGTSVSGNASLTVNQSALFIAMGTGNTLLTDQNDTTTYTMPWSLFVTDSNGAAVPGVTLSMKVLPVAYGKGSLKWSAAQSVWLASDYTGAQSSSTSLAATSANAGQRLMCANEDTDYSGILTSTKDVNHNNALDPGNVITLTPASKTVTTDSNGRALIYLQYSRSYAPWVVVNLVATATVSGTESVRQQSFLVPALTTDINSSTTNPPGLTSPFGVIADCTSPN